MFVVLHTGQTGVERGAHEGALSARLKIGGFMSSDRRDELGPIPPDVSVHLTAGRDRGFRPAAVQNINLASAVIVLVARVDRAETVPGLPWLLQKVRGAGRPLLVADPTTSLDDITSWATHAPVTNGSCRLFVTGPRATRWPAGEATARRVVRALGYTLTTYPTP